MRMKDRPTQFCSVRCARQGKFHPGYKHGLSKTREYHRAFDSLVRAQRWNAPGRFGAEDVTRLFDEQAGLCVYCRADLSVTFQIDHRIPLAKGGSNWPDNIQLLCISCNRRKNHKDPEAFRQEMERSRATAA